MNPTVLKRQQLKNVIGGDGIFQLRYYAVLLPVLMGQ